MMEIIPLTKECIRKFNILGADVSIAFAKYGIFKGLKSLAPNTYQQIIEDINYLYDCAEGNAIITQRLVLWRFKIEVGVVVEYQYSFT